VDREGERAEKPVGNKDVKAQEYDKGSKVEGGECSSRRVQVQLTASEGVVHVDDIFS